MLPLDLLDLGLVNVRQVQLLFRDSAALSGALPTVQDLTAHLVCEATTALFLESSCRKRLSNHCDFLAIDRLNCHFWGPVLAIACLVLWFLG